MTAPQLTLPLDVPAPCNFAGFHAAGNAELVHRLRALAARPEGPGVWLWGPAGCGRSHLLKAVCQAAGASGHRAAYLPLAELPARADLLHGLGAGVLALDDVEAWLGDPELEAALVGAYEQQRVSAGVLVVAAGAAAGRLAFALPDLASRCRALAAYRVVPLDDAGLRKVLAAEAGRRGLVLNDATADFWLARSRRSLPVLLGELERLDRVALAAQRRLTIPLLKDVLEL